MPNNIINTILQLKRGENTSWSSETAQVLKKGEPGFDTTNNILKIGNGIDVWENLEPINGGDCSLKIFNTPPLTNYLLANKEIGYDKTNNILKVGDGNTIWGSLSLINDNKPKTVTETIINNLAVNSSGIIAAQDINKFYHYKPDNSGIEYLVYLPSIWVQYRLSIKGIEYRTRNGVYSSSPWQSTWSKLPVSGDDIVDHSISINKLSNNIKNEMVVTPIQFTQSSLDENNSTFSGYWHFDNSKCCHVVGKIYISNNYSSNPWYINFNLPFPPETQSEPFMSYGYLGWGDPVNSVTKRGTTYLINNFENRRILSLTLPTNGQVITDRDNYVYVNFTYSTK